HCGQSDGPPWKQFDWPNRQHSLQKAVTETSPDILCVQEATTEQVAFLEKALPGHHRIGLGRDGGDVGEHCAIFFDRDRFKELDGGIFWREERTDQPRAGSAFSIKRICTWVRLRDGQSDRVLRIYNAHQYLTAGPRGPAAHLILDHIRAGDPTDAVVLTADF